MFEAESGFLSHCILQANWSMSILLAHYENAKIIEMSYGVQVYAGSGI